MTVYFTTHFVHVYSVVIDDFYKIVLDKKLLTEELQNIKQNWINLKKVSSLYGNELQDCLVSSGRLIEALETLEDWLIRVEPDLAEVKVSFRLTSGQLPVLIISFSSSTVTLIRLKVLLNSIIK